MSRCELYDILLERVKADEISGGEGIVKQIDMQQVCNTINTLWKNVDGETEKMHMDNIQALCLHHEISGGRKTGGTSMYRHVPFKGVILAKDMGIVYKMRDLPPLLQQIVVKYITTEVCE